MPFRRWLVLTRILIKRGENKRTESGKIYLYDSVHGGEELGRKLYVWREAGLFNGILVSWV